MKMKLIIIFIKFTLITSNINETTHKIKDILIKYKTCNRYNRCVNPYLKMENFAEKALKVLKKTERFGEYLRNYNISDCHDSASDTNNTYNKQHIVNGLLIHEDIPASHWHEYKTVYNKAYVSYAHERSALSVWLNNLRRVAAHNRLYLAGLQNYTLQLNHLGDWHIMSYISQLLNLIKTIPLHDPAEDKRKTAYHRSFHQEIPKQMDWREAGFKPLREEQFHCGACYAFAISHALQAQLYKRHGDWRELSPQQIVDCSIRDGNFGCNGGSLQAGFRYVSRAGLMREEHYPYTGKRGHCKYNRVGVSARPRRWATLPAGDEAGIERALATIGPLAVAVNASPFTFQLYRSGIYDDPFCTPWQLNHAMLLVGYTPEYWILLNWWGKQWGEDGYIRIRRGFNICGVANMATYVEL